MNDLKHKNKSKTEIKMLRLQLVPWTKKTHMIDRKIIRTTLNYSHMPDHVHDITISQSACVLVRPGQAMKVGQFNTTNVIGPLGWNQLWSSEKPPITPCMEPVGVKHPV